MCFFFDISSLLMAIRVINAQRRRYSFDHMYGSFNSYWLYASIHISKLSLTDFIIVMIEALVYSWLQ